MKILISTLLFVGIWAICLAQQDTTSLTLDDCIQSAIDRNISIKRARNNELIAKSNQFQSMMNYLPSVNGGMNYDFFFGTVFDQNAARQVSTTTNRSNPNVAANWTLFSGLQNYHLSNQRSHEFEAASYEVGSAQLVTKANILSIYLNVIVGEESIRISEERVTLLEAQLDRANKRESVGVGNMEDVYNFKSQLASEKLNLQNLKNDYQRSRLQLLQAMLIDPTQQNYYIEPIQVSENELTGELQPFGQLLDECLNVNPGVKSAHANLAAAKSQFKVANGARLPELSVFGILGSNYSSNGAINPEKPFNNPETGAPGFNYEPNATFFQQMDYNQFEYINFRINIPIFNQYQVNNRIQVAKLNAANADLSVNEAILNITNTVQQVYLDLIAARSTYESALENLNALTQSYEFMKKRYETGNSDFYTFMESLNNKNRAEIQLINARYSIVIRKKILDTYKLL